jgi:pimeloyl-ACP methyl ester carboxylesterase
VLVDSPVQVDPALAQRVGERLREAATLAPGQAQWDVRLFDTLDTSAMADRLDGVAAKIALPTLYVRGAISELVTKADAAAFVAQLPDGELVEVENSALVVTDDRADALGGYLIDFLERRAPRISCRQRRAHLPRRARVFRDRGHRRHRDLPRRHPDRADRE